MAGLITPAIKIWRDRESGAATALFALYSPQSGGGASAKFGFLWSAPELGHNARLWRCENVPNWEEECVLSGRTILEA